MIGYKGFDKNFRCRDMQYQVGQTYSADGQLKICENGLHFCGTPTAVFEFYPPADCRFAVVEALGSVVSHDKNPHKFCTDRLKIIRELSLIDFVAEVKDSATHTGDFSAATNTGDYSAATNTGDCSAAVVEGDHSVAVVTGKLGKAKGNLGSWLVLSEWQDNIRSDVQVFKVDGINIKPDTFYQLKDGKPVNVQEDEQ